MFIEPDRHKAGRLRSSEMSGQLATLRSSGAEDLFSGNMIYKHLAALRPGQDLCFEL